MIRAYGPGRRDEGEPRCASWCWSRRTRSPRAGRLPSTDELTEMGEVQRGARRGRRHARRRRPARLARRASGCASRARQADRHRRAVRRDQGTRRRLLDLAGRVARGGRASGSSASPFQDTEVEVRRVFEDADFGDNLTPELRRPIRSSATRSARPPTRRSDRPAAGRDRTPDRRRGLADRGGPGHRRAGSRRARRRPRRGSRAGRARRRTRAVAGVGVPDNPGAWLTAVARRRGVDAVRRRVTLERKVEQIGRDLADRRASDGRHRDRTDRARRRAAAGVRRMPPGALAARRGWR